MIFYCSRCATRVHERRRTELRDRDSAGPRIRLCAECEPLLPRREEEAALPDRRPREIPLR